ncbi:AAA family ATPase [Thermus brockianus]
MGRKANGDQTLALIDEALGIVMGEAELWKDPRDGFIPTEGAKALLGHLHLVAQEGFPLALVVGPAGVGKTLTCRYWAREHEAPWVRAQPSYSPAALLEDLAVELRITRTKTFRVLLSMVRDALLMSPRVIFVDEAQLLDSPTLETVKYLADETGSSFVLITSEEFEGQIRRRRDIESRIGTVARIGPISLQETQAIYKDSGYSPEVLAEVYTLAGGILRDIVRLMRQMDRVVEWSGERGLTKAAFTPAHVRRVASRLNLAGGAR